MFFFFFFFCVILILVFFFFFSSRRRHTRSDRDWSSDVCSSDLDLERARDMQQRQGDKRRLGEILVSLGVITQREVERQVHFQIEEVVFEVMSWNEGYFSFAEEAESNVPTEVTVRIPVEALLMEGARRIDEWSRIENRIPHVGVVPSLAPAPEGGGGELDLLPPEWEVLALIDGDRSVRGLATELGRSD